MTLFKMGRWKPPNLVSPSLGKDHWKGGREGGREGGHEEPHEYAFNWKYMMPRKRSPANSSNFVKRGAALVHDAIASNSTTSTSGIMQEALASMLEVHDQEVKARGSLVKRLTSRAPESAGTVAQAFADAMIDHAHPEDKRRMEALTIHAMTEVAARRAAEGKASQADAQMLAGALQRVFH
jgi:hypothetical protein